MTVEDFLGGLEPPDRALWARGPWDDEPEDEQFLSSGNGVCRHVTGGHWCGIVIMPRRHALTGAVRETCDAALDVFGGVKFAGDAAGPYGRRWAVGFAFDGPLDIKPGETFEFRKARVPYPFGLSARYRPMGFALAEVERLARQIAGWK